MMWRSVLWLTAAGAVLGGLYGCAVLTVMFIPIIGGGAGVRWAPTIVVVVGIVGAIPGWVMTREGMMRPLFGSVLGALALVSLPGLGLVPFSLIALLAGGMIGGAYGLVVGLTIGVALSIMTKVSHLPLADAARHRRASTRICFLVVCVLALVYLPVLVLYGWVSALTGDLTLDVMIYAGFPNLVLALTAEWVCTRLATWYARGSGPSPDVAAGRFEREVKAALATTFRLATGLRGRPYRLLVAGVLSAALVIPAGAVTYQQIQERTEDRQEKQDSVWMASSLGRIESSPQEPYLAIRSSEGLEVWNVEERQRIGMIGNEDLTYPTPSPNGRLLAGYVDHDGEYGAAPQRLRVVRVEDGSEVADVQIGEVANDFEWSPDGSLIAVAISEAVEVWRVRDGELLRTIEDRDTSTGILGVLEWRPDGRVLAVQEVPSYVALWDVATGRRLSTLGPGPRQVESISFSPDGRLIAMNGDSVELWDAKGSKAVRELGGHVYVSSLAFSPDGKLLATSGTTGEIRLWRISDGALLDTYLGHDLDDNRVNYVSALAFSSGGRKLFSYGEDGLVRVWPVERDEL